MEVYSNLFFSDDADPAFSNTIDYRGVTPNESKAHFKNKIERKRMIRAVESYKIETKYNCSLIHNDKRRISSSIGSIDTSTGYWKSRNPNRRFSSLIKTPPGFEKRAQKTKTEMNLIAGLKKPLLENIQSPSVRSSVNSSLLSLERPKTSVDRSLANEIKINVKKKDSQPELTTEILFDIEQAQDQAGMMIGRLNRSKSLANETLLPKRARAQSVFSTMILNNDPSQLKYNPVQKKTQEKQEHQEQQKPQQKLSMPNLDMEEKKLLELYKKKLEARNSVPALPPHVVNRLKSKDPVFAKRYRQIYEARLFSQAPKFDENDNNLSNYFPKVDMWRLRKRILKQSITGVLANKPKDYKIDMAKTDEKVKQFLDEVKVSQSLC